MTTARGAVPSASVRLGRAFAPAHVSGLFVPRLGARDPRARGSLGAGLVLNLGTTAVAEWRPASRSAVDLVADTTARLEISEMVARRLLARRGGRLTVRLTHALPLEQGFGSSAAGALATGLAVAAALELPRAKAVEVAHLADLFGRGGLGGVAAIGGGGLELRVRAGIPPFGRIVRLDAERPVLVGTVTGPIRSADLLTDPAMMRRFAAGEELFEWLVARPGWEPFWEAAERFTDVTGLAPPRLRAVLNGLRRRGARAAQAMFGGSFFATAPSGAVERDVRRWLAQRSIEFRQLEVARKGARTLRTLTDRRGR